MNIVTMVVGTVPETETTAPFIFEDGDKGGSITYDKSDGWLCIDLRKHFNVAMRVGNWARRLQVFEWDPTIGEWVTSNRDPGLPFMVNAATNFHDTVQEYLQTIPQDVLDAVAVFKWRRFVLMQMLRFAPEWAEVIRSNPMLVLLTADTMSRCEEDPQTFSKLVFCKRTEVLRACGMPANNTVTKLFSRIRIDSYSLTDLMEMRKVVMDPEIASVMRKIEYIDGSCLRFLQQNKDMLKYPFIRRRIALAENRFNYEDQLTWFTRIRQTVTDIRRMGEQLQVEDVNRTLMHCPEDVNVHRIHDEWAERVNRLTREDSRERFLKEHKDLSFPAPPIPGVPGIEPITNFDALQEEGEIMHHCVGSYAKEIMHEFSYIYRVLMPERATLEIVPDIDIFFADDQPNEVNLTLKMAQEISESNDSDFTWKIAQIKLARNLEPSKETKVFVSEWLRKHIEKTSP